LLKPVIYPAVETCAAAQSVTISNIASGETAYYTTDGTNPTLEEKAVAAWSTAFFDLLRCRICIIDLISSQGNSAR